MVIIILYLMLLLWGNFLVTSSADVQAEEFTCDVIKLIVGHHNKLRKDIANDRIQGQPQGKNILRLIWDDSLHKKAQQWAENLNMVHNPDRSDALGRFSTGENLAIQTSIPPNPKFEWKVAMNDWFNEYKDYKYQRLQAGEPGPATGHYTQFVWHNTMYIGCGATYYVRPDGWGSKLYVCNYGPAGNYIGQFPYEVGSGCTNLCCTEDHKNTYGRNC